MFLASDWKDYKLLDVSNGERLEKWGDYVLIRPDPQAIWKSERKHPLWKKANAHYHRSKSGGGNWEIFDLPASWQIKYKNLTFNVKPMNFKHTGIFPEQATNWDFMYSAIKNADRKINVLNLFGYTGAASMACAAAGASVCHVDASKGIVQLAKENAESCKLRDKPVRYIVDDCIKFVEREIRRGNKYDGIVMDPPSYGRGPNGEVWKIEQNIDELLKEVAKVLSDDALFFLLNSYTGGLSPTILNYMVKTIVIGNREGAVTTDEIGLKVTDRDVVLPCGATTVWTGK